MSEATTLLESVSQASEISLNTFEVTEASQKTRRRCLRRLTWPVDPNAGI